MNFKSKVLIHPGLNNSGERHWQTLWEKRYPQFVRIQQNDWDNPVCENWIATLDEVLAKENSSDVILVCHSLACPAFGLWWQTYQRKIKGALLVAPADTEAPSFPVNAKGFSPMPTAKFPFPTIMVMSTNDTFMSIDRSQYFAKLWGSELINIGNAGHINTESNLGFWEFGLELLDRLDCC